ncbi:MAG: caspase family protein, partial [Mesorhizobium sp.]
ANAVLIFYAGHGVQLQGENYLLPVDTPDAQNLEQLTARAIRLNDVIAKFASRERQTFIFLDACRNNPVGEGASTADGLAQVEVGENIFVAFATQPGNTTVDGAGDNSPFTTALLQNIEIPGLSISDMMIRVRNETEALTLGRQVP